jgi:hypothetical protein
MTGEEKPILVGWREWVALPELGVPAIKAKVDTGARSSSLHTLDMEIFDRDGVDWVRFHVQPLRRYRKIAFEGEAPVVDYRNVRDSGGHTTRRPYIRTRLEMGGHSWQIDINLTERGDLLFPMLLGRVALQRRCHVDPASSYLLGRWGWSQYPDRRRRKDIRQ